MLYIIYLWLVGWVNCFSICALRKYNAESPKQGSRRFNSIVKTKYIADLGIVYLCQTQRQLSNRFRLLFKRIFIDVEYEYRIVPWEMSVVFFSRIRVPDSGDSN